MRPYAKKKMQKKLEGLLERMAARAKKREGYKLYQRQRKEKIKNGELLRRYEIDRGRRQEDGKLKK